MLFAAAALAALSRRPCARRSLARKIRRRLVLGPAYRRPRWRLAEVSPDSFDVHEMRLSRKVLVRRQFDSELLVLAA